MHHLGYRAKVQVSRRKRYIIESEIRYEMTVLYHSLTFNNVIRGHFQLVRLAIGLIARFLDFAFAHTSPAAVATKKEGGGTERRIDA